MKVSIIIPAYNEAATISRAIEEVRQYFIARGTEFEIIVVADGTDGTDSLAQAAADEDVRVKVIASKERGGKGAAVKKGVFTATGDVIGYVDADGKTRIEELDRLLPLFVKSDVVIGSRAISGSVIVRPQKWYRRLGSRVFAAYVHILVGLREIPDTQCGFKFFRREVARELFHDLSISGYVFDIEILYHCVRRRVPLQQVGVEWADDGDSRLALVTGNFRNFFDVFKLAARHRFASAVVPNDVAVVRPSELYERYASGSVDESSS